MNRLVSNILFSILMMVIQVVVFSRVNIPIADNYTIFFFVYPLVILSLPISVNSSLVIAIAFVVGLITDTFNNSLGVNAGALVLLAYLRPYVLNLLEPADGYSLGQEPTLSSMGFTWYSRYLSLLLFINILMFFILEYFSYIYTLSILIQTIISFGVSWLIIMLLCTLFRR